jgi:membrane dipeptidase
MKFPVFDLHCDTALALLGKECDTIGDLRKNDLHIDLDRATAHSQYCQCFACFTTPEMKKWTGKDPVVIFERELAAVMRETEKNQDMIRIAYSPEEIAANSIAGKMSAILTIEGPAGFDFDPELLEDLYNVGFRITTLGWNEKNPLCGSHVTGGGLTKQGREYVKKAQSLGMLIDVSHISDEAFWDIIEITEAPVIASHSNSRAVWNVSRNLTDEMFLAICKTGGIVGINLYTDFLGLNASLDTVCDHILHFLSLDPDGKHIALGGDLDGCDTLPDGFEGIQDYQKLASKLLERGISQEIVTNIFWNNAYEVMCHAVSEHKK